MTVRPDEPAPARFRILFVCVGNVCRSVLAERLIRQRIETRLGPVAGRFHTGSAGTEAAPGPGIHPYVRQVLLARGASADGFMRRRLAPVLVARSDLVLAATAAERDRVISMVPAALPRTFTIREFARLSRHAPPSGPARPDELVERTRSAVAVAQGMRGQLPYLDPASYDVADPRPTRVAFEDCAATIDAAAQAILDSWIG